MNPVVQSNGGRRGFNNIGNRKSGWIATKWLNADIITEYTPNQGVQVIDGASSAKALETSTQYAPVVVNGSVPSGAGETLIADSAVSATWGVLSGTGFAQDSASFITTGADADLSAERIIQSGNGTTLAVGVGTRTLDAENLGVAGTAVSPSISADVLGRITGFSENSGPWTEVVATGDAVAGNNVASVDLARYQYFYINDDKMVVNVYIQFTTDNPVGAGETAITINNFPVLPAQFFSGTCFVNDGSGLMQANGYLTLDGTQVITYHEGNAPTALLDNTQYEVRGQIECAIAPV